MNQQAGRIRTTAILVAIVAAIGSVGLLIVIGRGGNFFRLAVFGVWILAPLAALLLANVRSKRWLHTTRTALHGLTLALAIGSLAIYATTALRPPSSGPVFILVITPLAAWLSIAFVLPIAALISEWRPRRGEEAPRRRFRLLRQAFLLATALASFAVAMIPVMLWVEHNCALELPMPTGTFAVGRTSRLWVDASRIDPYAASQGQNRELAVWIWYPTRRSDQAGTAPYLPDSWQRALSSEADFLMTNLLWRNPAKVHGHSIESAPLAQDLATYPVVIFRSGIGALALEYATLVEDLASHGYFVVGVDTPYSTGVVVMPDGRVVHATNEGNPGDEPMPEKDRERLLNRLAQVWTADTRFMLDELTRLNDHDPAGVFAGRLDLRAVGIVGHSFGGAVAAQTCHEDARFRAGIDMDGALRGNVVQEGIGQPFLFLLSDHGDEWTSPDCKIALDIRSVAGRDAGNKLIITLNDAHHFSFGDHALLQSGILRSVLAVLGGPGRLDGRRGLSATTRYVREFLDVHLRGAQRDAI